MVETVSEGSLSLLEGQLVTRRKGAVPSRFCSHVVCGVALCGPVAAFVASILQLQRCHVASVAFGPCQLTSETIGTISRRVFVSNALQMRTRNVDLKFD